MNFYLSAGGLFGAVGAAVLHFLWQGVVIGLIAAVGLRGCRRDAAQARYCVALAGLGACAAVFLVTVVMQLASRGVANGGFGPVVVVDGVSAAWWKSLLRAETVSVVWCFGVGVLMVRLCMQLAAARRLGSGVSLPPEQWVEAFERIKAQIGVHKAVRLLRHASIDTPMVVGWLKPVVLVPATAFTSLTPDQLCAVLAHELAHIRRKDHVLNALQSVVEVALFFHPVVWWLSSRARIEREHCCDDVAVSAAASPLVFAEALARLETLRHVFPQAAVAANGGSLMERIERVLKIGQAPSARSLRWGGVAAIAAGAVVVAAALAQVSPPSNVTPAKPTLADVTRPNELLLMLKPTQVTKEVVVEGQPLDEDALLDENVLFRVVELVDVDGADGQGGTAEFPVQFKVKLDDNQRHELVRLQLVEGRPLKLTELRAAEAEAQEMRKYADDLEAAVDAGQITREEADMKLAELRAQAAERAVKPRTIELKLDRHGGAKVKTPRVRVVEVQRLEMDKIADEVAAGTMTREEADARIEALRKMAAEREELDKREAAEREEKK